MNSNTREWSDRLREAERVLEIDPIDIQACNTLWNLLDGGVGNNLKGIERAVHTYRAAALRSDEGMARLSDALFEVFETSGRLPAKEDLGAELQQRIFDLAVSPNVGHLGWLRKTLMIETG
jgi:hypothetical protein